MKDIKDENFDQLMRNAFSHRGEESCKGKDQEKYGGEVCLSEETIADYLVSRLPSPERERAEEHFFLCQACRKLLTVLVKVKGLEKGESNSHEVQSHLNEMEEREILACTKSVSEILKISLAWVQGHLKLKETNMDSLLIFPNNLKPIMVRGDLRQPETKLPPLSRIVHGYKIIAQVEKEMELGREREKEKRCALRCEISPLVGKQLGPRIKVDLLQADRILCSYPLKDDMVHLQGIAPGEYEMRIRQGEHLIALLSLDIEDEYRP